MSLSAWELPVYLQWQWRHAALVSCMFRNQDAAQCAALLMCPSISDSTCASLSTYAPVPSSYLPSCAALISLRRPKKGLGKAVRVLRPGIARAALPHAPALCLLMSYCLQQLHQFLPHTGRKSAWGGFWGLVSERRNSIMLCAERCHCGLLLLLPCSWQQQLFILISVPGL